MDDLLLEIKKDLGIKNGKIEAQFYKFLIYDVGAFFVSHRDTVKAPGMFGTLSITLPSVYSGGQLKVRHKDKEITQRGGSRLNQIEYAAFYANCEHEVLPVHSGNRICLIYNLVRKQTFVGNTSP